jgi:hypothetical protein
MSQTRWFFAMALVALVGVYAAYTSPGSMLNAWVTGQCFAWIRPNVCGWHVQSQKLPNERPPISQPRRGRIIIR